MTENLLKKLYHSKGEESEGSSHAGRIIFSRKKTDEYVQEAARDGGKD